MLHTGDQPPTINNPAARRIRQIGRTMSRPHPFTDNSPARNLGRPTIKMVCVFERRNGKS
jgi:hypothetical protein